MSALRAAAEIKGDLPIVGRRRSRAILPQPLDQTRAQVRDASGAERQDQVAGGGTLREVVEHVVEVGDEVRVPVAVGLDRFQQPGTKRAESEYDPFGAAHSSTSISAGLGFAVGRELKGEDNNVVCVIGDGAMSAGMAYEAMNNAGAMNSRLIVVLNDNDMSIAPAVGAMSAYLSRLISSKPYASVRHLAKEVASM